jgi:hypothetical protein
MWIVFGTRMFADGWKWNGSAIMLIGGLFQLAGAAAAYGRGRSDGKAEARREGEKK